MLRIFHYCYSEDNVDDDNDNDDDFHQLPESPTRESS